MADRSVPDEPDWEEIAERGEALRRDAMMAAGRGRFVDIADVLDTIARREAEEAARMERFRRLMPPSPAIAWEAGRQIGQMQLVCCGAWWMRALGPFEADARLLIGVIPR
jgi:hypothetical protein